MKHPVALSLVLLFLNSASAAQSAAAPPRPAGQHAGAPAVAGFVRLAGTGQPVADARVTLFRPALDVFHEVRSSSAGAYAIAGVAPGSYRLGVAAPGLEYVELALNLSGPLMQDVLLVAESHPGVWAVIGDTSPETFDSTDIGVLRPDGWVLFCHDTTDPILFDPRTGQKQLPGDSGSEQGCMNSTLLKDGSVLIVGGQDGAAPSQFTNAIPWVKRFLLPQVWVQMQDMLLDVGRWYPGLARLADGRILVMGGGTAPSAERTDTCEIYDPDTGNWTWAADMGSPNEFAPSALLFDGRVLRTWGTKPQVYDPALDAWTDTGPFVQPARGFPGHSDHSLIVLGDGRALAVGIASGAQANSAMVEVFDPATNAWSAATSPDLPRMQAEVVALPDGRVLVQGGESGAPGSEPDVLGIVRRTDLFEPQTLSWRRVADTSRFREYHAVTLLLPDARVLTTGGTWIKFSFGPTSSDIDAYSPPYLFRGVRPQIGNLSDTTPTRGQTIDFDVFPSTQLTAGVLMGVQSTTHWVDGGIPRRLEFSVTQQGGQAAVTLPSDPNVLPVGWYLLFGMVDDIPSEALFLRVE